MATTVVGATDLFGFNTEQQEALKTLFTRADTILTAAQTAWNGGATGAITTGCFGPEEVDNLNDYFTFICANAAGGAVTAVPGRVFDPAAFDPSQIRSLVNVGARMLATY